MHPIMLALPFTLRQLQVFATLCEVLSFRECAEKLGISQASVSNQISLLEDQLGFKLFARSPGRRPSLTRRGLAFRADLDTFDKAGQALAEHRKSGRSEPEITRFRILVGIALFDNFVRPKLSRFLTDNPLIELEFKAQLPLQSLDREVSKGDAGFALFHHRPDLPLEVECTPIAKIRSCIYGDPSLAGDCELPMTPEQISELPFILPRANTENERELLANLAKRGIIPRNIICHTEYFDVMVAMVESGLGVACLSESLLPPATRLKLASFLPLSDWQLLLYRNPIVPQIEGDLVEAFLIDSVLRDPNYPTVETYA